MNKIEQLKNNNPEAAAQVEAALFQSVQTVEQTMPNADNKAKQIAALQLTYDALDLLIGAPGPVDILIKNFLIPSIPDLIDWAVAELKKAGVM